MEAARRHLEELERRREWAEEGVARGISEPDYDEAALAADRREREREKKARSESGPLHRDDDDDSYDPPLALMSRSPQARKSRLVSCLFLWVFLSRLSLTKRVGEAKGHLWVTKTSPLCPDVKLGRLTVSGI